MSPDEWDSLRWYEQRMYVEGFEAEGLVQRDDSGTAPSGSGTPGERLLSERSSRSGGSVVTERDIHSGLSHVPGEFARDGIKERTIPPRQ